MDHKWKKLPLFVILLIFLGSAYGFKGGDSNAHHWWGQPPDNTFSPHAVQSSVSEVPVTGILSEEVGSRIFTKRPLKRLNLLQFVKGHVSSRHESTSHAQSAPSSSNLASFPLPLSEWHAGSLALVQGSSGSSITDNASVTTQGESTSFPAVLVASGLSTSGHRSPSLYVSSSQETSAPVATYSSQGIPVPLSEGSGQSTSPQGEGSYSGLSPSQGPSSPFTPDSYIVSSSSPVSRQSTNEQSTPSLYSSSSQGSSGSLIEASGSSFQGEAAGLGSLVDLSLQSQETSRQLLPSPLVVSNQSTNRQPLFVVSESSSDPQSTGPASPLDTPGSLSHSILSTQTQGSASTSLGSSGQLIPTQVEIGRYSGMSQFLSTSSQYAPGSLLYRKFSALPVRDSSQSKNSQSSPSVSTSTQSRSGTLTSSHVFPVQAGSSFTSSSSQPQGTLGLYAPASPTKYVSVPVSSHPSVYSQSTSSSGAQFGPSTSFASQGMSSTYSSSVQPQGTKSQFPPGSASSYPSVSLASPQGAVSPSAKVQSSRKLFTSSYGTQEGSSTPINFQGSTTYGGSLQSQGTTSRFAPGSPSSYPSVSLSSPQGAAGPSATVQSSRKLFTSSYGTQEGSSTPINLQGSTAYGGSLQPQGTTSHFAPGSSSSYPSVSLASPQGAASPSAKVQSSRKLFTSPLTGSSVTQAGSSTPINFQGSTTYGGSLQPQGTTSQFAPGSSSSYPSVSLASPQGAVSPSATVQSSQKLFTSPFTGSSVTQAGSSTPINFQGSTTYGGSLQSQGTTSRFAPGSPSSYPSVSLSSPQGAAGPSATVQSSRKLFTSSYGTQEGSSTPINLQGSTAYGGSLQPQGTTSHFAPGSSSSYPSLSLASPQGAAGPSATVQSSRKLFTSPLTSSSVTQAGSSTPINFQGSATYGGSLQPQGTTSQFAPGSSSSYPSVSLASPQGAVSPSATVQRSQKLFTSSYGTQEGSSTPINLQGSTAYGGSLQPQGTTSQFALAATSSCKCDCESLSSPQGVASQLSQALQSYSVSQRQKSPGWQPSQGFSTSGATELQGSSLSQSLPMQIRFSSPSSAGGSSRDFGQFVSAQGGSTSYGGSSLHSQSPSSKDTPGSHAYAKLGSSPLAVSTQSFSDRRSNGLYSSDTLRTQGLLSVVERPSRLSYQVPSDSASSDQKSKHLTSQRPTVSNLVPSPGLSAQAPSVGMFSGVQQTTQAQHESGSALQPNQQFLMPLLQGLKDSRKLPQNTK